MNDKEREFITLFRYHNLRFEEAERLLQTGALDINMYDFENDEELLSEALWEYQYSIECDECDGRLIYKDREEAGKELLQIVEFFLEHGYDPGKYNGRLGGMAVWQLAHMPINHCMLKAAEMLLERGAGNVRLFDDDSSDLLENIHDIDFCARHDGCSKEEAELYSALYKLVEEKG